MRLGIAYNREDGKCSLSDWNHSSCRGDTSINLAFVASYCLALDIFDGISGDMKGRSYDMLLSYYSR